MCSIFGMGLFDDHTLNNATTVKDIMSRLLKEGEVAGRAASGVAVMKTKTTDVIRRALSGSVLAADDDYKTFADDYIKTGDTEDSDDHLMSIIGHCRMPTKGSPKNNYNNHPIVTENIVGVHNGVISNDDDLFNKFRKNITRIAKVDTEIIFQLVNHFNKNPMGKTIDAIQKATPYLAGSYACGMQNTRHPYNLYLFKHGNPIKILNYPKLGVVFFATREYFITEGFEEFTDYVGAGEPIDLIEDQGIVFNLWNHTFCKFIFRDKRVAQELGYAG